MSDSSDERALASALAASDDEDLIAVLSARRVPLPSSAHDFFDVAAALLAEPAVDKALRRLPVDLLNALAHAPDAPDPARRALLGLALIDAGGRPYAVVRDRLRALSTAEFRATCSDDPPRPADESAAAAAGERAFAAVASLADILLAARAAPLPRTGAGPVSVSTRRRLVDEGAVTDGEELDDLIALAASAGLMEGLDRAWVAAGTAPAWLTASTADRWAEVARGFVASLPEGVRTRTGGYLPPEVWAGVYPLDPDWPGRAADAIRRARRWGIVSDAATEPAWSVGLRLRGEPDLTELVAHLPPEVDRIYLQADLTAISPGPLEPAREQRLRSMTVRETRAQASAYRFTAETLTSAVSAGETAETLRGFLTELSLTGIPQPLEYLIGTVAARYGLIRVGEDPQTGRTAVSSTDPHVLATLEVDQTLRPIGLVRHGEQLVSRAARDTVYWALADARYPVVAVDGRDEVEALGRRPGTVTGSPPPAAVPYAALIATLRATHGPDADAAWLERELEQAVRARSAIEVAVRLPDGTTRTLVLEASGIGGGRLRGLDRHADVERTLPLSSITGVTPVSGR